MERSPATVGGSVAAQARPARDRILDPLDRASEILFGLIMVMTFTLSLGATGAGQEDVRTILVGALGCNLAWGIIDAAMYLMGAHGERELAASTLSAIRREEDPAAGRDLVRDQLPSAILPALGTEDLERIRLHLKILPAATGQQGIGRTDLIAAFGVFLLVFVSLFPVVLPFLFLDDVRLALRVSNAVAIGLLFLTGFAFGRHVGRPWRSGILMVLVGTALVAIAMALGG
ncbi:VIT1/CCC1 transporter family protein [Arvimicrobium flavum]|uniref:VIT1/CCC1 transporter family protein n=1 Tax=Arvimicrobium flavum TaxID=3393320 RepID=UPI00237C0D7F|nr:VIT1/CCC1 transporter family protein [Mesorhizobium shangrilense]